MELAISILVVFHLIGFGSLLGGVLAQGKELRNGGRISAPILHGSWLLLITGLALVGLVQAQKEDVNLFVLTAKTIVITVIFFLAYGNSKKDQLKKWVVPVIGLLAIVNLTLAVVVGVVIPTA